MGSTLPYKLVLLISRTYVFINVGTMNEWGHWVNSEHMDRVLMHGSQLKSVIGSM